MLRTGDKLKASLFWTQTISASGTSTASNFAIQTHFLPVASDPPALPVESPIVRTSDVS